LFRVLFSISGMTIAEVIFDRQRKNNMKKQALKILEFVLNPASVVRSLKKALPSIIITLVSIASLSTATGREGIRQFTFEPAGRVLMKGSYPQLGVRASGDLFLLRLKDRNIWLQTSSDGGDSFDEGIRVNDGGEVASHAENTPLMVVRSMREFYALWTAQEGEGDSHGHTSLRLATSTNWGRSFGKSIPVDPSGTASQSFYALAVGPDGAVYAAWLDGRDRGQGKSGSSAVYVAKSTNRGQSFEKSVRVALNVCPCCRPSIAFTDAKTIHIGWRGVFDDDIRDIFVGTSTDGGATFSTPVRVAEDNWRINGCPHSGPSLATLGAKLFAAWRTVIDDRGRVYVASSGDKGAHFSAKVEADAGLHDANHPNLLALESSVSLVFQAREGAGQNGWSKFDAYFRQIDQDGSLSSPQRLGHAAGSATYPTLLFERPDHLFVAWTEGTEDGQKVVMARGRLTAPNPVNQQPPATGGALPVTTRRNNDKH
jgi:hypothetical protein